MKSMLLMLLAAVAAALLAGSLVSADEESLQTPEGISTHRIGFRTRGLCSESVERQQKLTVGNLLKPEP